VIALNQDSAEKKANAAKEREGVGGCGESTAKAGVATTGLRPQNCKQHWGKSERAYHMWFRGAGRLFGAR
jgi:hypothetical protein